MAKKIETELTNEELEAEVKLKKDAEADKDENSDDEDEDCQCDEEVVVEAIVPEYEMSADLIESVQSLFEGADFSDEFKAKASTIFEATVKAAIKAEIVKIEEEAQEAIAVRIAEHKEETDAKIDAYMEEVVAEWAEENKLAIEQGLRTQIAESFIADLKGLFEKHNIDISPEEVDMFEAVSAENETLRDEVNSLTDKLEEADEKALGLEKDAVVVALSEGLAATQTERFKALVSEVEAKSIETFTEKAKTLRESIFAEGVKKDEKPVVTEDKQEKKSSVSVYAEKMRQLKKNND